MQLLVVSYAEIHGWLAIRLPPSIYSKKGMPDYYFLKDGRSVWVEFKGKNKKATKEQERFGYDIISYRGEWYVITSLEDFIKMESGG